MIEDKARFLRELAILGQNFGRKMVEEDLAIFAALIARHLDDRQWAYAFEYFTGPWKDAGERPTFMPTPQQLVDAGLRAPAPGRGLIVWGDEKITLDEYFRRLDSGEPYPSAEPQKLLPPGPGNTGHAELLALADKLSMDKAAAARKVPALTADQWEQRRAELLRQSDDLLGPGEPPRELAAAGKRS